ncbi:hypothetical protein LJR230_004431 [Trinickia sp. LjRoot230]|uniref:hypothetical protein n=1 Tax=Trinickia sp. LjRoot230 TaxID=3342288 RepID=UPI003ECF9BDA
MSDQTTNKARTNATDEIVALAQSAGLLVTLDGRIGRETYQSVAGSLTSFLRFADALRASLLENETV